jgi:dTDP-4-dehydrorhamnose reductase
MIYIYGSTGMLGKYVSDYLEKEGMEIRRMTRSDNIHTGDIAINCAGLIKQKMDSFNEIEAIRINSTFPFLLKRSYNYLIQISTDCVFSGTKGNYMESDIPDATDLYGISKAAGETGTVIRTSMVGEGTFKKSLLEWVLGNNGKTIDGYINHLWNGVTCLQLAKAIAVIINEGKYWEGVRHYFAETVSKAQLVSYISDVYDANITINEALAKESINRTLNTIYSNTFIKAPGILQQLIEQHDFYK